MNFTDIIITLILLGLIGMGAYYLYRVKKRGQACVGCPYSKECSSDCGNCGTQEDGIDPTGGI